MIISYLQFIVFNFFINYLFVKNNKNNKKITRIGHYNKKKYRNQLF